MDSLLDNIDPASPLGSFFAPKLHHLKAELSLVFVFDDQGLWQKSLNH
jgi:hypothetical protein